MDRRVLPSPESPERRGDAGGIYIQTYHQCHLRLSRTAFGMGQEEESASQDSSIGVGWIHYKCLSSAGIPSCVRAWQGLGFHRYRWDNVAASFRYTRRFKGSRGMGTDRI